MQLSGAARQRKKSFGVERLWAGRICPQNEDPVTTFRHPIGGAHTLFQWEILDRTAACLFHEIQTFGSQHRLPGCGVNSTARDTRWVRCRDGDETCG